jgi:phosphoserine aminotransferase
VLSGHWSKAALKEAQKSGRARVAGSTEASAFDRVPAQGELDLEPQAAYLHFTSNNTIYGTQWSTPPEPPPGVPLVCDASSDALSRPIGVDRYLIYAGQKNLVQCDAVIRRDLLETRRPAAMLDYRSWPRLLALATPRHLVTALGLVPGACWLAGVAQRNEPSGAVARLTAAAGFTGRRPGGAAQMNVTFRLPLRS